MIVLPPNSFCPKMNVHFFVIYQMTSRTFDIGLDIRGSKSDIFESHSHNQEDSPQRNFQGYFGVVVVFYFERHTYNYSDNGEHALILPKLEMRTIILGRREEYT